MKMKKLASLLLALALLFSLAGCGAGAAKGDAGASSQVYSTNSFYYDSPAEPMEAPAAAAEETALGGFAAAAHAGKDESDAVRPDAPSAGDIAVDKIIYSAGATIETTEFDDTLLKLEALCCHVCDAGNFAESDYLAIWNVGNADLHIIHKRKMMLAI